MLPLCLFGLYILSQWFISILFFITVLHTIEVILTPTRYLTQNTLSLSFFKMWISKVSVLLYKYRSILSSYMKIFDRILIKMNLNFTPLGEIDFIMRLRPPIRKYG